MLFRSVLGAGEELPPALRPEQWAGQPGTRAPHVELSRGEERLSILDLFQRSWVLLTEDERWLPAVARAREQLGLPLEAVCLGGEVRPTDPEAFQKSFGVGQGGASLIRPDGYVAWRSGGPPAEPLRTLTEVLGRVSSAVRQ